MGVVEQGSNIVVTSIVGGSVFPTTERELVFPVLVDGSEQGVRIDGALYGRSLEIRGDAEIRGAVVARGDARLAPRGKRITLLSGLTINGSLYVAEATGPGGGTVTQDVRNAAILIKGDIAVNQNVSLKNAIVFGSIRAVNCTLENTLVLGTCLADENLRIQQSTIGGYAARDVSFEGPCVLLNALGESRNSPLFLPYEAPDGRIRASDLRYYPAIRGRGSMMNHGQEGEEFPPYSALYPGADWMRAQVRPNPGLTEGDEEVISKWVLSLGGRIGDLSLISEALARMTQMLKCGFEYEHYHPARRPGLLARALEGLTDEERWILAKVCDMGEVSIQ